MKILKIKENLNWIEKASFWFSSKWDIPQELYKESMLESIKEKKIPQWYIIVDEEKIIGGAGVIENDFHNRKDLSPNICALYIEENFRMKGYAKKLLNFIAEDMEKLEVNSLYLITDHINFYEKCGWKFLCMVKSEDDEELRMYNFHL